MKIALVGKKAAGKSLVSLHLKKVYKFKQMPLAYGVDRIYRTLFYTEAYKRVPWEYKREIYDALYDVDPEIWMHFLEKRLKTTVNPNVVVDDPRYVNEVLRLKELGFFIVRVETPDSKQRHISKGLSGARQGSVVVHEYFNGSAYKVDYSISNETRVGTKKATDILISELTQKGY